MPDQLLIDPYDPRVTAETFDINRWLVSQDWEALAVAEGRRPLTRLDPMLFALVYLPHHLTGPPPDGPVEVPDWLNDDADHQQLGEITFADAHFEWYRLMRTWALPTRGPRSWRHSFAAPRSCAKSTVWFTVAPLWAAAHGHAQFIAAFADSGGQAEMHLQTFRRECVDNPRLRSDYPKMCTARRKPTGRTVADNEGMYQSESGFVFVARGADTASLGMKVGQTRPDVLILDDIEKHEAQYSEDMVRKRLGTIINAIFPLNERARVVIVGTTTRAGSIVHQLVQVADGEEQPSGDRAWIAEERITPHHHLPIVTTTDGGRRSIWPGKWPLDYLESIEGTRSYELNMLCNPRAAGGVFWDGSDHIYGLCDGLARVYAWLDPPTTSKRSSDPAGLVIAAYVPGGITNLPDLITDPVNRRNRDADTAQRQIMRHRIATRGNRDAPLSGVVILHAEEIERSTGRPLLRRVAATIARIEARYGKRVRAVLCEANQGGELWNLAAEDLVIPLQTYTTSAPKAERIERSLDFYQALRVIHAEPLPDLERQQIAYPGLRNDDVVDAGSAAVLAFLDPKRRYRSGTEFPT